MSGARHRVGTIALSDQAIAEFRESLRGALGLAGFVIVDDGEAWVGKPIVCVPQETFAVSMLREFAAQLERAADLIEDHCE